MYITRFGYAPPVLVVDAAARICLRIEVATTSPWLLVVVVMALR